MTGIRRAVPADLAVLLDMAREFNRLDRHAHDDERVGAALAPLLAGDDLGVVYLFGEPPAGYAVVTWGYSLESGGRDALLDEIFVEERGRGVGGAALDAVLADLRRRGLPRIFLETERRNRRVRRFYTRHGFHAQDSVWMSQDL